MYGYRSRRCLQQVTRMRAASGVSKTQRPAISGPRAVSFILGRPLRKTKSKNSSIVGLDTVQRHVTRLWVATDNHRAPVVSIILTPEHCAFSSDRPHALPLTAYNVRLCHFFDTCAWIALSLMVMALYFVKILRVIATSTPKHPLSPRLPESGT